MDLGMTHKISKEIKQKILMDIPIKNFGNPHELISTINYLVESQYITGTSINLNGGLL